MLPSYQIGDSDSFEELHIVVEQLELCQQLLRSRSNNKARAAVILLDHIADVIMYRMCMEEFRHMEAMEMVIPPEVAAAERNEILFRFEKKVSYLIHKKKIISQENATVLSIGHKVRNFAYHRDYHNPRTISTVGRILYKSVCDILPILGTRGTESYSSDTKGQLWTKRYGVAAGLLNYRNALDVVAKELSQRITFPPLKAVRVVQSDLAARYKSIQYTIKSFRFHSDLQLNAMLRHYEFLDIQADYIEKVCQPLKDARYLVYELHKGLPSDQWNKVPETPEKRREIRRAMLVAERQFRTDRRKAFRGFKQTVSAQSLKNLNNRIKNLRSISTLSQLLFEYSFLDRELARTQSYVNSAESDAEAAAERARGK